MHIFCEKIVHSLKNNLFLCPYYVKKTSILTKTNCSHIIFIKIFIKNSLRSCQYFVKKTSILSKLITHYDQKSEEDVLFFGYFRKKALMHIYFQKKNVHSFKRHCPHAHILSKKTSIFSKTLCFYVNFFKIFIESP